MAKAKAEMTKRERRNRRNLITASVVLAAVILLAVAVSIIFVELEEEEADGKTYVTIQADPEDVVQVSIRNSYDDMTFFYNSTEGTWYYSEDLDFPVSQSILSQVATQIAGLTSTIEIGATEKRLEEYGLTDPGLVITLYEDEQGEGEVLDVGAYNSLRSSCYLYNEKTEKIYLVDSSISSMFDADLYSYAEVDTFPTLDSESFVAVQKSTGNNTYYMVYEEDGLEGNMFESMTWYMGEPFSEMHACQEDKTDEMFENLTSLSFSKLVDYYAVGDELAEYGLDDPEQINFMYLTASGEDDDGNTTYNSCILELYVGSADTGGEYYYVSYDIIMNGLVSVNNHKVSLMSQSDLDWLLSLDPFDYIYKNIFYTLLSDMYTLDVEYKGETYSFTIDIDETVEKQLSSTGEEVYPSSAYSYYADGKELDSDEFRNAYQSLISLKALELVSEDKQKEIDPVISWTITQNKLLDTVTVELTKYSASAYQVTVNGVTEFLVSKQEVIDAVEGLIAAYESVQ